VRGERVPSPQLSEALRAEEGERRAQDAGSSVGQEQAGGVGQHQEERPQGVLVAVATEERARRWVPSEQGTSRSRKPGDMASVVLARQIDAEEESGRDQDGALEADEPNDVERREKKAQ
jgi:hypothetical protein